MAISTATTKHLYKEALDQVNAYNSKLLLDRRYRMPYIDNQTGLAQQDCHLWVSRVQRCTPLKEGQIYSYPSRRWRVRKRPDFTGASKQVDKIKAATAVLENNEESQEPIQEEKVQPPTATILEESNISYETTAATTVPQASYEEYFDDDTFDSEFDSDEEFGKRGRKRKGKGAKSGRKKVLALKLADKIKAVSKDELSMMTVEDRERPYDCQICGKRYKNQQGLRYHYEHYNHDTEDASSNAAPSTPLAQPPPISQPTQQCGLEAETISISIEQPPLDHVTGAKRKKGTPASQYCDFCLGNTDENKKSGTSEELISCADCGRSGHPSCLQFNENLTTQVKKYKWQCIECKCCCLCGTSDNDDQLLFCDDCDRGYHMYCLNPPIAEPPEGSWQCQLCEARVKGTDFSNVSVLSDHMDVVVTTTE